MRDWNRSQADRLARAISGDEGVELRGQLRGLWRVEGAGVRVAQDVGFDRVGELEGEADAGGIEGVELGGEEVGVFGEGGLVAERVEGGAGEERFGAPG